MKKRPKTTQEKKDQLMNMIKTRYLKDRGLLNREEIPSDTEIIHELIGLLDESIKLVKKIDYRSGYLDYSQYVMEGERVTELGIHDPHNCLSCWYNAKSEGSEFGHGCGGCQGLREFPNIIVNLTSLRTLIIEIPYEFEYGFAFIPSTIGELENLETLIISNKHLKELPEEIGLLKSLEHFELKNWESSHLPDSIKKLKNLKTITINSKIIPLNAINLGDVSEKNEFNNEKISDNRLTVLSSKSDSFQDQSIKENEIFKPSKEFLKLNDKLTNLYIALARTDDIDENLRFFYEIEEIKKKLSDLSKKD